MKKSTQTFYFISGVLSTLIVFAVIHGYQVLETSHNKALTPTIELNNPHVQKIMIDMTKESGSPLYSVVFNDHDGYDFLTPEELEQAVSIYPSVLKP